MSDPKNQRTPLEMLIGDEAQLRRRLGELETQSENYRMDELKMLRDHDRAIRDLALQVQKLRLEPEDAPERDFPCCDQGHADPPPPYILPLSKWQFAYVKDLVESDVRERQGNRNFYTLAEDLLDQLRKY